MEKQEIVNLLDVIEQQVSSAILGGETAEYEELEAMGYVRIDRESAQWSASITPAGEEFLRNS